jgi:hypothetical protein
MICLIFLGVLTDTLKCITALWLLPQGYEWRQLGPISERFNVVAALFMQLGLVINLRIWMSYLLKV